MTASNKTALIIGATGSFGAHAVQALIKRGWTVRALARDPAAAAQKLGPRTPIDWVQGDAMDRASVVAAATGAQLVVHAANPPNYRNWKGTVLPMADNAIAAALAAGARLVMPGSVYNFAPDSGPAIGEDAAQRPATRKGALRVELERRLRAASDTQGLKVLVLRSGDFFGPAAPNSALGWLTRRGKSRVTGVFQPGPSDVGHAFAYMPDLAETLARLVEAEDRMAAFEVFHFRGQWLERNDALGAAIRRVVGRADLPVTRFPWIVLHLAAPFNETFRELLEMRYLWDRPIGLSNAKLVAFIGEEPHTPLDAALRATLADMGCLEEPYVPSEVCRTSSAMAPTM
ncbi:MAG TPA: NAD-dependent epimerase/dehydratase family protein [Caulobacteraceae bacterium]|jgi:nucleoside-diphosphate-sugar epimerase|nr:NAD-dependent epimerase/dehydratase family protein [Caulobacteraceae bacterium]